MAKRTGRPRGPTSKRGSPEPIALPGLMDELLETSNAIIIGIDTEGRIELFNSGARRALGYTFEEVAGRSWFDLLADSDADSGSLEVFQFDIGSGARTQYEKRVLTGSGLTVTISIENTVMFDAAGEVSMVLMVGQDITRTKELERTLMEQNDRLVDAMEELTLYADLLLHDMKNANAGILGYLDLIGVDAKDDKVLGYYRKAVSEVKRATSIIDDVKVVTLTRPKWEPTPVDLDAVFAKAVERAMRGEGAGKHRFHVERSGLHVMADELLEEAVVRALDICMRHVPSSTIADVEARRDPSGSTIIAQPVHLKVKCGQIGSGRGGGNGQLAGQPGTGKGYSGMGMYIIKRIVGRYNGTVWVEAEEKGCAVHMLMSEAV